MRDQVDLTTARRWYAVVTQPSREAVAMEDLAEEDFEVFLPLLVEDLGHPRRGGYRRTGPMFRGYVFVHTPPAATRWRAIAEARAVVGVVCCGDRPAPILDGAIERLQRLALDGDGTIWIGRDEQGKAEWRAGPMGRFNRRLPYEMRQRLHIIEGPLMGLSGLYMGGEGLRLKLVLDIAGTAAVTELPEALVSPA